MTKQEFKEKYFTNNFYWINKENYEKIQLIGIEMGCVNPINEKSIIKWHKGFSNLGFRTYMKNDFVTKFQKEPFLLHTEKATNYNKMILDYSKIK